MNRLTSDLLTALNAEYDPQYHNFAQPVNERVAEAVKAYQEANPQPQVQPNPDVSLPVVQPKP